MENILNLSDIQTIKLDELDKHREKKRIANNVYRDKNKERINKQRRDSGYDKNRRSIYKEKINQLARQKYSKWKEENKEMLLEKSRIRALFLQSKKQHTAFLKSEASKARALLRQQQKQAKEHLKSEQLKIKQLNKLRKASLAKEKIKLYNRTYNLKNKNKLYEKNKRYVINSRERVRESRRIWQKTQYKNNIQHRLKQILRERMRKAFKRNQKTGSAVKDLGCSIEQLKKHLESKFLPNMTWTNYGPDGWHIDHIIPLTKFNLSDRNEFLKACHYTNLQPLWAIDNIKKSNK